MTWREMLKSVTVTPARRQKPIAGTLMMHIKGNTCDGVSFNFVSAGAAEQNAPPLRRHL